MIGQELQTQNQESETAKQDHNPLDEDQNIKNHEQAHSESSAVEVMEWRPRKARVVDRVFLVKDKLWQARRDNKKAKRDDIGIYKIPHYLYENDKKSYFPQTVSIGPYHYGKEHLQAMECQKWRAVSMVLERTNQDFEMYFNEMKKLEEEACDCYEGLIDLNRDEFTEMLVVDGCFVLELLAGVALGFSSLGYAPSDPVFAVGGMMHSIRRDMLMLENQIPFFILCKLAEIQNRGLMVRKLADHFFGPLMPTSRSFTNTTTTDPGKFSIDSLTLEVFPDELHCLDLFRYSLLEGISEASEYIRERVKLPLVAEADKDQLLQIICVTPRLICERDELSLVADKRQQRKIPCVTELRDAGFKFRKKETDSFWKIKFTEGYLEIPKLLINDDTKCLFLNLIAYEQRRIFMSNYVTSYIIFMDNLIDSAEDVHYLRQCGIIEHSLGSDSEFADMFNGLCHEVVFNTGDVYLSQLLDEVKRCYKRRYFRKWNAWMRTLKNKYFDSPWAYLSFFAALILLFLTCAQTYFAAYDYFKSGS